MTEESDVADHGERLVALERDMDWLKRALDDIRNSTVATSKAISELSSLEARHQEATRALERAFGAIENVQGQVTEVSNRLHALEREMPTLDLVRRWFFGAVLWALGMTAGMGWLIVFG